MHQEFSMTVINNRWSGLFWAFLLFISPFFLTAAGAAEPATCAIQHGACQFTTPSGMTVEFDIQPKPVKAMSKLQFFVSLKENGKPVTDALVTFDLTMPGMYMGKNAPDMKHITNGRYEGNGIITRCMSGRKTWQADITIERSGTRQAARFVFEVQ
jgi:hypothetical protein